jgi:multicomponent Na+:H+ antiporter subunit G
MDGIFDIVGDIFLLLGAFMILSSSIGMTRMQDFYTRSHPAGINDSMSLPLILIGVLFKIEPSLTSAKIILIIIFSMITSATASHALTKSAIYEIEPRGKKQKNYKSKVID